MPIITRPRPFPPTGPSAPSVPSRPTPAFSSEAPEVELLYGPAQQPIEALEVEVLETRTAVNEIPSARVVLGLVETASPRFQAYSTYAGKCAPGTRVTIKVKGDTALFSGIVLQQELSMVRGKTMLTLKLKHELQRLIASHRSQIFESMSDAEIIRTLLVAHGIQVGQIHGMELRHSQMIQFCCSDWQFLKARLSANPVGLLAKPTGVVEIGPPMLAGRADHTLSPQELNAGDTEIESAHWAFSCANQPSKLEVSSWDVGQQALSHARAARAAKLGSGALDPSKLALLGALPWSLVHSMPLPAGEETALANARLLAQHAAGVQARFKVIGSTGYGVGQTLALSGFGNAFDGTGLITEVSHEIRQGTWRTTIATGQELARALDMPLVPATAGLYVGVVDTFKPDETNLNRIRVKVPALDNHALWARFAAPYASKDSGVCFYPEPGDEVVLGFFDNDPRHMFILGAMHNPKNKAPYPPSAENSRKGMVIAHGDKTLKLLFDTKESSVAIAIDQGQEAKERFALDSLGAHVSSQATFEISAKQAVTLKGQSVSAQAVGAYKVEAGSVEVAAKETLKISGQGVTIQGSMVEIKH